MTDSPRDIYERLRQADPFLPPVAFVAGFSLTGTTADLDSASVLVHVQHRTDVPHSDAPTIPADGACGDCGREIEGWQDYAPDMDSTGMERLWLPCGHAHTTAEPGA